MHTGDGWAVASDGSRFWGTLGAAGLFLLDPDNNVLMQHRSKWTAAGGTWALPGGAIEVGETPAQAATRENWEETGIATSEVRVLAELLTATRDVDYALSRRAVLPEDEYLLEGAQPSREWLEQHPVYHPEHGSHAIFGLGGRFWWEYRNESITQWTYTTVIGRVVQQIAPTVTWESQELRWVPVDRLESLPLMPAFAESLPTIRAALQDLVEP